VIEYDEFVPVATKMLKSKNKKIKKRRKKEKKKIKKALPHASKFKAADLDKYVHDLFAIGDTNGDGVLEPRELKKLLQMSGFKLSAKEIHTFVQQADTNNDGVIEYREFAPVMSAMLQLSEKPKDKKAKKDKKSKKKKLDASKYSPAELEMYFQGLFKVADANGDGVLELDELTTLLKLCGFDLSAKEIEDFVNAADTNHDGVIEYDEFVPVATKMLKSKKGSKMHPSSFSPDNLEDYLGKMFGIADENGDGTLAPDELTRMLRLCQLDLSAKEIEDFVNAADTNHDGVVDYEEFLPVATKMMLQSKPGNTTVTATFDGSNEQQLQELFTLACGGEDVLTSQELLKLLTEGALHLTTAEIKQFISDADSTNMGQISFPVFVQILESVLDTMIGNRQDRNAAAEFILQDMRFDLDHIRGKFAALDSLSAPTLDKYFRSLFKFNDSNRDGMLPRARLSHMVQAAGLKIPVSIVDKVFKQDELGGMMEENEFVDCMVARTLLGKPRSSSPSRSASPQRA